MVLVRTLLLTTAMGLGCSALMPSHGHAAGDESTINRLCLAGFNAAMSHAGKTPPAGMGIFTCNCFLEQVKAGASIQNAQDICKQKAAERYKF
jgi:hypothetical protein